MRDRTVFEQKARALVARMTLEERAGQLRYDAPAIKHLGVPAYNWWNEALHGVARAGTATSFPQAIGMAAMFDEELLEQIADAIATEGRAKYHAYAAEEDRDIYKGLTFWSPNINIFRDPRWGRGHETYGEDPYLTSRLGQAFIRGLQGGGTYLKTAACAKHFAVHSGPEAVRHEFDAVVSPKDLWETYLPAFEECVTDADVESVMGAYNRTNGEPCCGSYTLLRDILRERWKFKGHVVSDCWAIKDFHVNHLVTATPAESAALALKAGCDLNCGYTYLHILKAYQQGLVTEEEITTAAERLFTTRFMLGLFEETEYDRIPYEVVECREHLELSEKAARQSVVLLKNNGILPLKKKELSTIGVIGPNADSRLALKGNYYGTASRYITLLEGIQDEVGEECRVLYSEGCHVYKKKVEALASDKDRIAEAVIVARHSDIAVLCLGLDETIEGEEPDEGNHVGSGDKDSLSLPGYQQELLEAVIRVGKPVIVCLMAGSSVDLNYADEHAAAVLQAWYPGARGGKAVADILFGACSPSGKLPVTCYRSLEGMPAFEDYSLKNRTYRYLEQQPLYPFGYGLNYGKTRVTGAALDYHERGGAVSDIAVRVGIENCGSYDTDEVIQIYIKPLESEWAVKNTSLCGFTRVFVPAGEKKEVSISISPKAFTVVNEQGERYVDGRRFALYAATHQPDDRSRELTGTEAVVLNVGL